MEKNFELAGSNTNSRNWKGIAISLLVICVVASFILLAVALKKSPKTHTIEQKPFTFDDILYKNFEAKRFSGIWIDDYSFVYQNDHLNIIQFDCKSMKEKTLMANYSIKQLVGDKFRFFINTDPTVILFSYDMKNLYRHSVISRYKLFNTISNLSFDVQPNHLYSTDQIQNAVLSPNSRKLAFVYKNNIFLMSKFFDGNKEAIQITHDGKDSEIYNGITDWLYEEEILYQTNAIWWSPDSKKMAYIKFNDSQVEFYKFPLYDGSPYGYINQIRYPKPDTKNPSAFVFIYNTEIGDTLKLIVPDSLIHKFGDYYIWNIKWLNKNSIIVVYVNRKQNKAMIVINDINSGNAVLVKEYPSAPMTNYEGWFLPHGLLASNRYNVFYQIWPYEGYKTIIAFDTRNGDSYPVTNHKFDVTDIVSFREKTGDLFYLATNGDPKQRHLFKKRVTDLYSLPQCLTCNETITIPITEPAENSVLIGESGNCLYYFASFSVGSDYYALECLGDRIPITYIKSIDDKTIEYVFEKNDELKQLVESRILPRKSYLRVFLDNNTGAYADAEILYPQKFELSSDIAYPVLIYVYNGPSSQIVDYQFRVRKFETFLCTNFGVIVATMDGRGTDANGDRFLKIVSKRLGEIETQDQLSLVNSLKNEIYTDDSKFAIWGWSYGGFLSAMALFQANSPFKCAISGAPVSDWLFYDSAYTERYLGSFSENRHSYEKSNLTNLAKNNHHHLSKKRMLLIHGTGDDNVHFQNSAVLAKVLRSSKIDLEFEVFPDVQHTPDEETQRSLYLKASKFLLNCFNINHHLFYEQLNLHHLIEELEPIKEESKEGGM